MSDKLKRLTKAVGRLERGPRGQTPRYKAKRKRLKAQAAPKVAPPTQGLVNACIKLLSHLARKHPDLPEQRHIQKARVLLNDAKRGTEEDHRRVLEPTMKLLEVLAERHPELKRKVDEVRSSSPTGS